MICPFATYKPISVNHGGMRAEKIGFVVHVQQGDSSLYGFFDNPSAQVSAHFWCSKSGALEQYLDTDLIAWAEAEGNASYASCEFEGFDTESMTPAQIVMGGRLAGWLSSVEGWPVVGPVTHGSPGITPHCNPNGTPDPAWGNHPCPGTIRLGQIPAIVAAAHPTPDQAEGDTVTHWQAGGQDHIAGVIGTTPYHWWQQTPTGDPAHPADPTWHVEQLPI